MQINPESGTGSANQPKTAIVPYWLAPRGKMVQQKEHDLLTEPERNSSSLRASISPSIKWDKFSWVIQSVCGKNELKTSVAGTDNPLLPHHSPHSQLQMFLLPQRRGGTPQALWL